MDAPPLGALLVVNADDYGYFRCVSQGILKSAEQGIVTATGVLANAPRFDEHAARLRDASTLDAGIHLNLTAGDPLTRAMRSKLSRWGGRFAGKFPMAMAVLARTLRVDDVRCEWQAQIERCRASGLQPVFLNSHEHIHMLPALFSLTCALARDHGIPHVRYATSQLGASRGAAPLLRHAIMTTLATVNRRHLGTEPIRFLGMEASGRLDRMYLERIVPRLCTGEVYELMCHPGHFDENEVSDPRLIAYHDWEGELRTLTSPATRELLDRHGVRVVGYRHLEREGGRLVARRAPCPRMC